MREIVAILVLVAATTFIDVGAKEASFITGFAMLICLAALIYLSMALAERFNPNVKKWHRITPGKKPKWTKQIGKISPRPKNRRRYKPPRRCQIRRRQKARCP